MFAATLIPTVLIESLVLTVWHRAAKQKGAAYPFLPLLFWLTVANLLTQALLYFLLSNPSFQYWPALLLSEILIVVLEARALVFAKLPFKVAVQVSLLVNLISFLTGLLIPA